MTYKTYAQIREKIEKELDLSGETFVDPVEMMDYVNEAIDEAAAHIYKLGAGDDYFLKAFPVTIVQGQQDYALPTDIYANQIKRLVWNENQTKIFEVRRLKNNGRFVDMAVMDTSSGSTLLYNYILYNDSADVGVKAKLYPTPQVNGPYLTVWYNRTPNKVVDDNSKVDIPQFYSFIQQFMKWKVCAKETHPNTALEYQELERVRSLMIATLEGMVQDEDNKIEMDMSFYEETV